MSKLSVVLSCLALTPGCLDINTIHDKMQCDSCDDGNDCTDDDCLQGVCNHYLQPDGTACDQGQKYCASGQCQARIGQLCVPAETLDFGTIYVGQTKQQLITLSECSQRGMLWLRRLAISNASGFFIQKGFELPHLFMPGEKQTLVVDYRPRQAGQVAATLELFSDDKPDSAHRITLLANSPSGCQLVAGPVEVDFGQVEIQSMATRTVKLTNKGSGACWVESIELIQPAPLSAFSLTENLSKTGLTLAPGQEHKIKIGFSPVGLPLHRASLWVSVPGDLAFKPGRHNAICNQERFSGPVSPGRGCLPLQGRGNGASLLLFPNPVDFGWVPTGCDSASIPITVANVGLAQANLSLVELSHTCDQNCVDLTLEQAQSVLQPGQMNRYQLRATPEKPGQLQANLSFYNAQHETVASVALVAQSSDQTNIKDCFSIQEQFQTDVLFVVNSSAATQTVLANLMDNFDLFLNWASHLDTAYQIGVIASAGQVLPEDGTLGLGGLVHRPDQPHFLTEQSPHLLDSLATNLQLACCNDEQQAGLLATLSATRPPIATDQNLGFFRPQARLFVILVSEQEDQSPGPVELYADYLNSTKTHFYHPLVVVNAVIADGTTCPEGNIATEDASRYRQLASQFGGEIISFCSPDWPTTLNRLGQSAFQSTREVRLSRQPDVQTLSVWLDDTPISQASCPDCDDGWIYHATQNSISIGTQAGTTDKVVTICVTYESTCSP